MGIEGELSEVLVKGAKVQALIQCVGLWFAGGKYGCSWKVLQIKVTPPQGVSGYSFIEDSSDEEGDGEGEDEGENEGEERNAVDSKITNDESDDDELADSEFE